MGVYRTGPVPGTYELQPVNYPVQNGLFTLRVDDSLSGGMFAVSLVGQSAPIATVHPGMDPQPRVDLLFDRVDAAAVTALVEQISVDGVHTVRTNTVGGILYAAGGFTVTDYEPPLGVPVTYQAMLYDVEGRPLGYTEPAVVQVDIDPSMAVISDPLSPADAVMVEGAGDFAARTPAKREMELHQIGDQTIALMGALGLAGDIPISVQTKTIASAAQLIHVLKAATVLVRTMPGPLPFVTRALHVVIPVVDPQPVNVHYGGSWVRFPLVGHQVTRTPLPIIESTVTWQQVIDAYPSWDALLADYPSWLALLSNPPSAA